MSVNQGNPYGTDADPYDYDYQPNYGTKDSTPLNAAKQNVPAIQSTVMDEESIRLRAMELAKREAELEKREKELLERGTSGVPQQPIDRPNWPRCYPLVYHSISSIPGKLRRTAAVMGYVGFFIFTALMILNFIGAMITISPLLSMVKDDLSPLSRVKMAIMALLFMVIAPVAHFAISYWSLYKAMQTAHIARFALFFVTYAMPILFCGFCFTGWYDYGPCGLILMIMSVPLQTSGNLTIFIVNTIMTLLYVLMAVYFLIIYIMALHVFRQENHTFKKARDFVRQSLVTGVTTAVSQGVSTAVTSSLTKPDTNV